VVDRDAGDLVVDLALQAQRDEQRGAQDRQQRGRQGEDLEPDGHQERDDSRIRRRA